MNSRIMYIEQKTHAEPEGWRGPAWIGRVTLNRTGKTLTYKGKRLQKGGTAAGANYHDIETNEGYWISGPKKNGQDRHERRGGGPVHIDEDVREEYWTEIRRQPERVMRNWPEDEIAKATAGPVRMLDAPPFDLPPHCDYNSSSNGRAVDSGESAQLGDHMNRYLLLVAIVVSLAPFSALGRELIDEELSFKITIPDEFVDAPAGKSVTNVVYAFATPSAGGRGRLSIVIMRMRGTLAPGPPSERLRAFLTPSDREWGIYETEWDGYSVYGGEGEVGPGVLTRGVIIPLRGEAIQITVGGRQESDAQITELLEQLLASLEGESNWGTEPTAAGESRDGMQINAVWIVGVTFVAFLMVAVLTIVLRERRT